MKKGKNALSDDVLQKALQLMELVGAGEERWSLAALSRHARLSRYKTMRLLASLEEKGAVDCAVRSGGYDAGRAKLLVQKLLEHARNLKYAGMMVKAVLPEQALYLTIRNDARPVLEALASRHNEAVYTAVLNGDEVFLLDMVDSQQQEKAEPLVGRHFPVFSNAAGKAMRAIDSWDLLEKIGRRWRGSRERYPDLEALKAELEQIRERGVAVDCSGMGGGVTTVAVAIRDYAGKVVGALMMLGPSFRLFGARLEGEIIPSLRLSAELLSGKFGYARP